MLPPLQMAGKIRGVIPITNGWEDFQRNPVVYQKVSVDPGIITSVWHDLYRKAVAEKNVKEMR